MSSCSWLFLRFYDRVLSKSNDGEEARLTVKTPDSCSCFVSSFHYQITKSCIDLINESCYNRESFKFKRFSALSSDEEIVIDGWEKYVTVAINAATLKDASIVISCWRSGDGKEVGDKQVGEDVEKEYVGDATLNVADEESFHVMASHKLLLPIIAADESMEGYLSIDYLYFKSTHDSSIFDILWSPDRYPVNLSGPIITGHRGAGSTLPSVDTPISPGFSDVIENTIESFEAARNFGAEAIEFDVVTTKDFRDLFVYHDMDVKVGEETKPLHDVEGLETLHSNENMITTKYPPFTQLDSNKLFPLLRDVFVEIGSEIIFNIEIKYQQVYESGRTSTDLRMSRNQLVDAIIDSLLALREEFPDRKFVCCTFDADIATIIAFKQPWIPVMINTKGFSNNPDSRLVQVHLRHLVSVAQYAHVFGLFGVSADAGDVLHNDSIINYITKDLSLKLSTWGRPNNDFDNFTAQITDDRFFMVHTDKLYDFYLKNLSPADNSSIIRSSFE